MISSRNHQAEMRDTMICPFCGFRDPVLYKMQFHIESFHTPDSPFVVEEEKAEMMELIDGEDSGYVICTEETCGEPVLRHEFQTHLDMHLAERVALDSNDERPRSSGDVNPFRQVSNIETGGNSSTAIVRLKSSKSRSEKSTASAPTPPSSSPSKSRSRHRHSPSASRSHSNSRSRSRSHSRSHSHSHSNSNSHSQSHFHSNSHSNSNSTSHPQSKSHSHSQGSNGSRSHRQKHGDSTEERRSSRKKSKSKKSGTAELGPYAMEKHMPMELYQALLNGPPINHHLKFGPNGTLVKVATVANETTGLIPVIAKLCEKDEYVSHAWLCDDAVRHVGKQMNKEGGFCGYRNIQMMISYMQGAWEDNTHPFQGMIPSIIRLQDQIERGWDMGINTHGKAETGGIRGTRKYIGTSEAETFFVSLGLPCGVKYVAGNNGLPAHEALYDFLQRHFESSRPRGNTDSVLLTHKPPIYFQHAGHSMTIIGLERYTNGARSLLVFDPSYSPCPGIRDLVGVKRIGSRANIRALLQLHRRGTHYLHKYQEFELLTTLSNNKYIGTLNGFHMHEFLRAQYR